MCFPTFAGTSDIISCMSVRDLCVLWEHQTSFQACWYVTCVCCGNIRRHFKHVGMLLVCVAGTSDVISSMSVCYLCVLWEHQTSFQACLYVTCVCCGNIRRHFKHVGMLLVCVAGTSDIISSMSVRDLCVLWEHQTSFQACRYVTCVCCENIRRHFNHVGMLLVCVAGTSGIISIMSVCYLCVLPKRTSFQACWYVTCVCCQCPVTTPWWRWRRRRSRTSCAPSSGPHSSAVASWSENCSDPSLADTWVTWRQKQLMINVQLINFTGMILGDPLAKLLNWF